MSVCSQTRAFLHLIPSIPSHFPHVASEPGDYIKRFSAGNIFSRIGISSALAGPTLTKIVQEKCSQDAPDKEMKDLLLASGQRKLKIGALIAAEARKLKERASVVNDIGPCRRALCARRDFHIRKQLRRHTTTKVFYTYLSYFPYLARWLILAI